MALMLLEHFVVSATRNVFGFSIGMTPTSAGLLQLMSELICSHFVQIRSRVLIAPTVSAIYVSVRITAASQLERTWYDGGKF